MKRFTKYSKLEASNWKFMLFSFTELGALQPLTIINFYAKKKNISNPSIHVLHSECCIQDKYSLLQS